MARRARSYGEGVLLSLVEAVYDAAGDLRSWPGFLNHLADTTGTSLVLLRRTELEPRSELALLAGGPSVNAERHQIYNEYFGARNPMVPWTAPDRLRLGRVMASAEMCSDAQLVKSEFYAGFFAPGRFRYAADAMFHEEKPATFHLTLVRKEGEGEPDRDELELLDRLVPHVGRAWKLNRYVQAMVAQKHALEQAIDRVQTGMLLIDDEGRLVLANREARAVLGLRDGLSLDREGRLCAARPKETGRLRRALAHVSPAGLAAVVGNAAAEPGDVLLLRRPSGRKPLRLLVVPLRRQRCFLPDAGGGAYVAVFVSAPERRAVLPEEAVQAVHGLTPAEARLAVRLARGSSLREAAEGLGVTMNTARSTLKSIFAKTQTRRQSDLVSCLLSGIAAAADDGE